MDNVKPIRAGITVVEKHQVAARHLLETAHLQALALSATLRLINGAFNDRELNPNESSPFDSHFPDEINSSIGRTEDTLADIEKFKERLGNV